MGHAGYERCLLSGSSGPGALSTSGWHQVRIGLHGYSRSNDGDEVLILAWIVWGDLTARDCD